MNAIKSSLAISRVDIELKINVSETGCASIIRNVLIATLTRLIVRKDFIALHRILTFQRSAYIGLQNFRIPCRMILVLHIS